MPVGTDNIAGAGSSAADRVVRRGGDDSSAQKVVQGVQAGGVGSDQVALNQIAASVANRQAIGAAGGDDVARPRHSSTDGVIVTAVDHVNAVTVIAEGCHASHVRA